MEKFNLFMNKKKKMIFKESIKNLFRKNKKGKINLTTTKNLIIQDRYKSYNKKNNSNFINFPDNSKNLTIKNFNKNINTTKSYSIKLKQKNNNKLELRYNTLTFHKNDLLLKKKENNKNRYHPNINVNSSTDIKDIHLKKNNLFLSFNNNIKIEKEKNIYIKTLENNSKETINTDNNHHNYINNIINININVDKKRRKYRNHLSQSLKNTINYFAENIINKMNNSGKNIKWNIHLKNNISNNASSFKSMKSNRGDEILYNHTISNEMINSNKLRSKNTFIRLLSKNKQKKNNYISFGQLIRSTESKRITKNIKENNSKIIKNNILFKVKNNINLNHKIVLLNNINPIINCNNNNNKKTKKKKNLFIQKQKSNESNQNQKYDSLKNNYAQYKDINFIKSPKDKEVKLFLRASSTYNNYINYKPEYVKEYNEEILLNLLIDEYITNKKIKLKLNKKILNKHGINPSVRSYLIDSLISLQDTFKFHNKTLFITLNIFDNYISSILSSNDIKNKIEEEELDLIFTSCFLIASKSEESFIYHLTDYLSILSDKYTVNDLITMEYNILKFFNFEAFFPNVLDFFQFFSVFFNLDKILYKKGVIILFIILNDLDLSQRPASLLAFSVVCFLNNNVNFEQMCNKLDGIFDYLNEKNNNVYKSDIYEKFIMLINPLKNMNEIKNMEKSIWKNIKNPKKENLNGIIKKIEEYNNLI